MRILQELRELLVEAPRMKVGTMVSYKAGSSQELGVVVGQEGRELLVVGASTPELARTVDRKRMRDYAITTRLGARLRFKGVRMDVQRVPYQKTRRIGILTGRDVRLYKELATLVGSAR